MDSDSDAKDSDLDSDSDSDLVDSTTSLTVGNIENVIISNVFQDAAMLDSLTGIPTTEDILLFCIPVCAPYSALTNYRYSLDFCPVFLVFDDVTVK